MVALLVSCASLIGSAPAGAAILVPDDLCALGGPACAAPEEAGTLREYATPVEVDCPAAADARRAPRVASAFGLEPVGGDCSPPSLDFHYRVSRSPESERPSGALRPQRNRRNAHPTAACTGLPPERGTPISTGTIQPIAVYAVLALLPPSARSLRFEGRFRAPVRALEPLDRPPRA